MKNKDRETAELISEIIDKLPEKDIEYFFKKWNHILDKYQDKR